MKRVLPACAVALALAFASPITPTPAAAQSDTALDLYGRGVHQYYSGQYFEALKSFDGAAAAGSEDPRVFYYRGLVQMAIGNEAKAQNDWKTGASLEAADRAQGVNVGRSLMRVQGTVRMQLEQARLAGKSETRDRVRDEIRARYENLNRAEGDVLLRPARQKPRPADIFSDEPGDTLPAAGEKPLANPVLSKPAEEMPAEETVTDKPAPKPALDPAEEPAPEAPAKPKEEMPPEDDGFGDFVPGGLKKPAARMPAKPATDPLDDLLKKPSEEEMPEKPATPPTPAPEDKPAAEAPAEGTAVKGKAPGRFGRLFGALSKPAGNILELDKVSEQIQTLTGGTPAGLPAAEPQPEEPAPPESN